MILEVGDLWTTETDWLGRLAVADVLPLLEPLPDNVTVLELPNVGS